jgi:hypothetical protein
MSRKISIVKYLIIALLEPVNIMMEKIEKVEK